jgi:hypothetical protein
MPIREPFTPDQLRELAKDLWSKVEALPESGPGAPGHDLVLVVKSLMRGAIVQARAYAAVCDDGLVWAAGSNLRSIFDLHADLRLLLESPEPERMARRIVLFAMQDMANYEPEGNEALTAAIDGFRRIDPEAVRQFEEAWKKNHFHWSGSGRTTIMDSLDPSKGLRRTYKGYSWGAHGVIEPVLDYDWSEDAGRRPEAHRQVEAPRERVDCSPAADLLRQTWSRVSKFFNVAA